MQRMVKMGKIEPINPSRGRSYRLSLDDNIWFLQDIARSGYASLFDNPYLRMYRDIHEQYGTKVHINIYYECPENGGFTLREFPDRYQPEWERNADWLRLSLYQITWSPLPFRTTWNPLLDNIFRTSFV